MIANFYFRREAYVEIVSTENKELSVQFKIKSQCLGYYYFIDKSNNLEISFKFNPIILDKIFLIFEKNKFRSPRK
jgi:hypothetical protein